VLRCAWDGDTLATATKSPVHATDAHISLVGHITIDELLALLRRVEISGGLANRFLWLLVRRARVLPFGGSPGDLNPLTEAITAAADFARTTGDMTLTGPAKELWRAHYERLTTPPPGVLGEVLSRAAPHVLRLGMLYALAARSKVIAHDHLAAALAVWDSSARCASYIFGADTGDRIADRILAKLRDTPEGMSRTEIRRVVFGDNIRAERVKAALVLLLSAGLIRQEINRATGGAPAARFFASGARDKREKRANPPSQGDERATYHVNHVNHVGAEADITPPEGEREVFEL
jgi:hypothetical protein